MDMLGIVLSSALTSGAVSAVVAGWFGLRSKQAEYANTYYRMILERRLTAYEGVENLVGMIKVAVVDADNRPYHVLFSADDDHAGVFLTLKNAMSNAMWLSDELFELTREFNLLCYSKVGDGSGLIEFGKRNYREIAELRTRMERVVFRDLLTLHDAPAFLKTKKPSDSYQELPKRG